MYSRLPLDLERYIFEMAVTLHKGSAFNLMLVAYRARFWIERLLYHTLVFDSPNKTFWSFMTALQSRPSSFFATHVRNLHLSASIPVTQTSLILSICTGVTDLGCWIHPYSSLLPYIDTIRPTRLSIKLESLIDAHSEHQPKPDFRHPILQNLTHLEIVNPPGQPMFGSLGVGGLDVDWEELCHLPHLTHLALGQLLSVQHIHIVRALPSLLSGCSNLKILVIISSAQCIVGAIDSMALEEREPDRFVRMDSFCQSYRDDAVDSWRQNELWTYAEHVVEARSSRA